jgi:Tfp pilus assembly protein PilN
MINLLPQSEKKKILNAYRLRLGVIVLCMSFVLLVFAAVSLAPSYIHVDRKIKALAAELAEKKQSAPVGGEEAQQELTRIKEEIARLKLPPEGDLTSSALLTLVLAHKPVGIDVTSMAYADSNPVVTVQLSGMAAKREDLLAFQRNLEGDTRLTNVKYAQSFIIQKTDIAFQLTITIK